MAVTATAPLCADNGDRYVDFYFILSKSRDPWDNFFFTAGMFVIGYCILLWRFCLWNGRDTRNHCAKNDFFLILRFAFLAFTSDQDV